MHNTINFPASDVSFNMAYHNCIDKVFEPDVTDVILRLVRPGDFAIDAGANIGFFTLLMSKIVGPEGMVLAFEPDEPAFEALESNVGLNDVNNVALARHALWESDANMTFWPASVTGYSSFVHYGDISLDAKPLVARSLDSLLGQQQPDFIKIDCEGADGKILKGAEQILRRGVRGVTVEFNFYLMGVLGLKDQEIRGYMKSLGYDCFVLDEGYTPTLLPTDCQLAAYTDKNTNMLFSTPAVVAEAYNDLVSRV